MHNSVLGTATGCTEDKNIHLHEETLTFPIHKHLQFHASQFKQKHIIHHIPANISTDLHTVTTAYIKTRMRHNQTSMVSRHLVTRSNNNILYTRPPHIISSEEILPRLTRRSLAQLRTNNPPFSNHAYTNLTPNHIHHHYSSFVTLIHTTQIIFSTASIYATRCHPWILGQTHPPGDGTADQIYG